MDYNNLTINRLINTEYKCECGKTHRTELQGVYNKIGDLERIVSDKNIKNIYVVCDENTVEIAKRYIFDLLDGLSVKLSICILKSTSDRVEPCEKTLGKAVMEYKKSDAIIGVGSGTVNDICKFLKVMTGIPYIIVGTAPSMDGYASNSSSMIFEGVKTTIYTACPDYIICDPVILNTAPYKMKLAGIGDILAKYVSICEWRISNLITDEYYCEKIANMMRKCANDTLTNAEAFLNGNEEAVNIITEALIKAGIAMAFAEISRPASGIEHYYSHLWEMRSIEQGITPELHGIQVGLATLKTIEKYERLRGLTCNKERAEKFVIEFDNNEYYEKIKSYFGSSGEKILSLEKKEGKYDKSTHPARLQRIIANWENILQIVSEELPSSDTVAELYKKIKFPYEYAQIGENENSAEQAFTHTKDIRDKYILSRLLWDIGYTSI